MWFERMALENWFDTHQFSTRFDVGESAIKFLSVADLDLDLSSVELRYGHHTGHPQLRDRIAEEYEGLGAEHVLVTSGAAEAIFCIAATLLRPGDHVVVEHPNYPSTYDVPRGLGCEVSLLKLEFAERFQPDLDRLRALIRPETKLIIFTHPNNPTGSMIPEAMLRNLIELAEDRRVFLLFDETYRHLAFDALLPTAASLSRWAISVTSMSKCYGLPGIRIGWLATRSREILDGVLAVREQITITNTALSEAIATAVLERRQESLDRARAHVRKNLGIITSWMGRQGQLEWVPPEGGVVFLPRLRDTGRHPERLYRSLAVDHGVFVIPGRCFELDNRFFRMGCGAASEELQGGLDRIDTALDEFAATPVEMSTGVRSE